MKKAEIEDRLSKMQDEFAKQVAILSTTGGGIVTAEAMVLANGGIKWVKVGSKTDKQF